MMTLVTTMNERVHLEHGPWVVARDPGQGLRRTHLGRVDIVTTAKEISLRS
jgi:hypothetical protein